MHRPCPRPSHQQTLAIHFQTVNSAPNHCYNKPPQKTNNKQTNKNKNKKNSQIYFVYVPDIGINLPWK